MAFLLVIYNNVFPIVYMMHNMRLKSYKTTTINYNITLNSNELVVQILGDTKQRKLSEGRATHQPITPKFCAKGDKFTIKPLNT